MSSVEILNKYKEEQIILVQSQEEGNWIGHLFIRGKVILSTILEDTVKGKVEDEERDY